MENVLIYRDGISLYTCPLYASALTSLPNHQESIREGERGSCLKNHRSKNVKHMGSNPKLGPTVM